MAIRGRRSVEHHWTSLRGSDQRLGCDDRGARVGDLIRTVNIAYRIVGVRSGAEVPDAPREQDVRKAATISNLWLMVS